MFGRVCPSDSRIVRPRLGFRARIQFALFLVFFADYPALWITEHDDSRRSKLSYSRDGSSRQGRLP